MALGFPGGPRGGLLMPSVPTKGDTAVAGDQPSGSRAQLAAPASHPC